MVQACIPAATSVRGVDLAVYGVKRRKSMIRVFFDFIPLCTDGKQDG